MQIFSGFVASKISPSRIINVSSSFHEKGEIHWDDINFKKNYSALAAYRQSKLANVMHAKALARKLASTGIDVFSVNPGLMKVVLLQSTEATCFKA